MTDVETMVAGVLEATGNRQIERLNILGRATALLQRLANMWEIKVVAGTGLQNPAYWINTGKYVECLPANGACRDSPDHWGAIRYH